MILILKKIGRKLLQFIASFQISILNVLLIKLQNESNNYYY